jgi:hypothetical protein
MCPLAAGAEQRILNLALIMGVKPHLTRGIPANLRAQQQTGQDKQLSGRHETRCCSRRQENTAVCLGRSCLPQQYAITQLRILAAVVTGQATAAV